MTQQPTTVSVIVCAYTEDRWDDLVASVESVRGLPESPEVLLVIDHNDGLLARSLDRWSDVVVAANESRQGLSGARNTGWPWPPATSSRSSTTTPRPTRRG